MYCAVKAVDVLKLIHDNLSVGMEYYYAYL